MLRAEDQAIVDVCPEGYEGTGSEGRGTETGPRAVAWSLRLAGVGEANEDSLQLSV